MKNVHPHRRRPAVRVALASIVLLAATAAKSPPASGEAAATLPPETPARARTPDVVYVPTPQPVVDRMLELAELKPDDVVYDLGCGDGRIVVTAAKKYGVKAVGFDIDPQRVKEARENARAQQVGHLVTIREADIFTLDLTPATVVTLYLLPSLNVRLMPQLAKLRAGSRILSHNFDMRGAKPLLAEHVVLEPADNGTDDEDTNHTIYKWVVPWAKDPSAQ